MSDIEIERWGSPSTTSRAFHYPSTFERVVRGIRDIAAIIALLLVSILMALMLTFFAGLEHRLSQINDTVDPGPVVTGCPFGDGECGG